MRVVWPWQWKRVTWSQLRSVNWAVVALIILGCGLAVRLFVATPYVVAGDSMRSSLHDGDRVMVDRVSYRFRAPERGEVVVFPSPNEALDLVKRVVAVAGETVEVSGCVVTVDGVALDEPYLTPGLLARGCGTDYGPFQVPASTVFVLGDNRGRSSDSRVFGPVATEQLIGRAVIVAWPHTHWRLLDG
jgi:signal peptidase I